MMALFPMLTAAKGEGCAKQTDTAGGPDGTAQQVTPDVSATWDIDYADDLEVEIAIGGALYHYTVGVTGGVIELEHEGKPYTFDLDCARPEVICPTEVWPSEAVLDQRDKSFPRNVYVTVPFSECAGELVEPEPADCGEGTHNESCEMVCDGAVETRQAETFGRISLDDTYMSVLLGGGIATNGYNCALLHLSVANATLVTTGSADDGDWKATEMPDGEIITGLAAGCLWAPDVDWDGTEDPAIIGASITLTTSFTGARR